MTCAELGRLEEVEETLQQLDARAESFEIGLHHAALVVFHWVRGLLLAGLLDRADQTARLYRERCQDTPGSPADGTTSFICAAVAAARGQVKTAARWHRQSIAALHGTDPGGLSFHGLVFLTGALGMAGDATSARQTFVEMTAARHPTFVYLEPDVRLAQAWVAAAEGGLTEAIALARQAAEVAASQHQPAMEVFALHTAVCFGDRTVADRLTELATQVDGPRAPAAAAHAVSVQLEEMGALLLAADAAAQAAVLHRARGTVAQAAFASARATALAQRCEGARTPALLAGTSPLTISAREREVATLAASGLTNKQIAARLLVSVRTVEGHIYRACTGLGVTDRTALAALLTDPTGPTPNRTAPPPATPSN